MDGCPAITHIGSCAIISRIDKKLIEEKLKTEQLEKEIMHSKNIKFNLASYIVALDLGEKLDWPFNKLYDELPLTERTKEILKNVGYKEDSLRSIVGYTVQSYYIYMQDKK